MCSILLELHPPTPEPAGKSAKCHSLVIVCLVERELHSTFRWMREREAERREGPGRQAAEQGGSELGKSLRYRLVSRTQGSIRKLQQPWSGCKMVPECGKGLRASEHGIKRKEGRTPNAGRFRDNVLPSHGLHKTYPHLRSHLWLLGK